ncbi:MAG: hypothetical protein QM770_13095 [Tepidisphaeraceae bacterium]
MNRDRLPANLNVFQRLMLQWEQLAPYNAAQHMAVAGELPQQRVADAWLATVRELGLEAIGQDHDHGALIGHPVGTNFLEALNLGLNWTISEDEPPLRPIAFTHDGRTDLAIVYRHVVADSASIRLVMRHWFGKLFDDRLCATAPVQLDTDTPTLLGMALRSPVRFAREAWREYRRLRRMKTVKRVSPRVDLSAEVCFERREMPQGFANLLLAAARKRNAKVNDLFVAAGAMAATEHLPMESSNKRPNVGFGTIVDTRTRDASTAFGLSLGFLQTLFAPTELSDLEAAIQVAALQSEAAKARGDSQSSLLRLAGAERWGRHMSDKDLAEFYRKRCPLVGGVSNVNLNRDWAGEVDRNLLLDYTRISPLGPMLSVVFTPTTLGNQMHMGFTWRRGILNEVSADAIARGFLSRLASLVEPGSSPV